MSSSRHALWLSAASMLMLLALEAKAHDPAAGAPDPAGEDSGAAAPATPAQPTPPPVLAPEVPPEAAGLPLQDPDPLDMIRPVGGAAAGCACGLPCGIAGTVGSAAGAGGAVGILSGLPAVVAGLGLLTGACIGVPAMACAGPCSVAGATTGTIAGAQSVNEDVNVMPILLASLPAFMLAMAGSLVGAIGTGAFISAVVGMNPGELRSWGAVVVLAVMLTMFSGPLAAILAVSANTLFGGPVLDEEGAIESDDTGEDDLAAASGPQRLTTAARLPSTMQY